MSIMDLLLADMPYCSTLLQITPVFRTHQGSWDKVSTDLSVFLVWRLVPVLVSAPKFTVDLYCICIDLRYTYADAVHICGKFWNTQ